MINENDNDSPKLQLIFLDQLYLCFFSVLIFLWKDTTLFMH